MVGGNRGSTMPPVEKKKQGSFGIPADLHPDKIREERDRAEKEQEERDRAQAEKITPKEESDIIKETSPEEILKKIGVEFTDEDLLGLITRGYVSKRIPIIKDKFNVTMKTITVGEMDVIDEILAKESQEVSMTKNGYEQRRSVLTLAASVTEINGKTIPNMSKLAESMGKSVDKITMTDIFLERRKYFREMDAGIIDTIGQKQAVFTTTIRVIVNNPTDQLKNS